MRYIALQWILTIGLVAGFSANVSAQKADDNNPPDTKSAKGIDVEPMLSSKKGQFRAVLVGVNDYERLKDLSFCEEDVCGLRDQLVKMGFRRDTIKCLTTGDPDPAYRPNYRNISERLDALFSGLDKDSVLVIALSGHGGSFEFRERSGAESKASFYCPQDARIGDPRGTMIPVKSIYDRLEKCPAKFKMLLVDACRDPHIASPGARTAIDESKSMAGFAKSLSDGRLPRGTLALVSCTSGEQSYEDPQFKHGIFMYYLLEGLAGLADAAYHGNRNGMVSYRELKDYVYRKTSDHAWQKYDQPQTPEFLANVWELPDFDLSRALRRETPVYTKWPFDADEARHRQEETARAIDQPVDFTNSVGMRFKLIPAGEFMMGSPEDEKDRHREEGPIHRVRITKPFYLGMYEVTVGQFRKFVYDTSYKTEAEKDGKGALGYDAEKHYWLQKPEYTWRNPDFSQSDDHPVVNVSWNDAVEFCKWLSRKKGREYRLPTEAQWEYACRAGTTTRYYNGNDSEGLALVGNVSDGTAKEKFPGWTTIEAKDGYVFTAPAGRFGANAFGLYDMHGNVWEWCGDWYDSDYYTNSPTDDPTGPTSGSFPFHVYRGGGWFFWPRGCQSALRSRVTPGDCNLNLGFRLALVPSE